MPLHLVFCGTPEFALPALRALATDPRFVIDLVVTQPDRPVGRKQVLTPPPVKREAEALGLTVAQPEKLNAALPELQTQVPRPDILVVVAYGQILSQAVLDWPSQLPVNVHASLLPRWRGASPIEAALVAGDQETGVTIQRMVRALDAGDILSQRSHPITGTDTSQTLRRDLAELGATLLVDTLTQPLTPVAQDASQVTLCTLLSREDGSIDCAVLTATEIERRWRAFTPWPGLTTEVHGEKLKLRQVSLSEQPNALKLDCAQGTALWVTEVQAASGTPMAAADWLRGRRP
jgi:methionyl-tRNA formyltransferase